MHNLLQPRQILRGHRPMSRKLAWAGSQTVHVFGSVIKKRLTDNGETAVHADSFLGRTLLHYDLPLAI